MEELNQLHSFHLKLVDDQATTAAQLKDLEVQVNTLSTEMQVQRAKFMHVKTEV